MGCDRLNETQILDLCWVDEQTLVLAAELRQVWKYTIDTSNRTCKREVMDYLFTTYDVSCTREGKVYASRYAAGYVKIKIFDMKTGNSIIWELGIYSLSGSVLVSVNQELIIVDIDDHSYVYNSVRYYLYKIKHDTNNAMGTYFKNTYLTDNNFYWGVTEEKRQVSFRNLLTNETYITMDGIQRAYGVSGTNHGYVYVSREIAGSIGVYSEEGVFLYFLQMDPPVRDKLSVVDSKTSAGVTYLASSSGDRTSPVAIYHISV